MKKTKNSDIIYQPIFFMLGVFLITWCCAGLMTQIDYSTQTTLFTFLDFMENASPLFCALILFRKYWAREEFFNQFFLGRADSIYSYIIVFLLFAAQFLNFYLFQRKSAECSIHTFIITFVGQFLLGGGLEEAGWRGYLLPCFYKKHNIILSSTGVSIIWVFWHLPYFFIPGSMQAGDSFISYSIIGIITGFILSAIYLFRHLRNATSRINTVFFVTKI